MTAPLMGVLARVPLIAVARQDAEVAREIAFADDIALSVGDIGAWLRAGAFAAGVGSGMTTAHERDGPDEATALSVRLVATATATTDPVPRTTTSEERPR